MLFETLEGRRSCPIDRGTAFREPELGLEKRGRKTADRGNPSTHEVPGGFDSRKLRGNGGVGARFHLIQTDICPGIHRRCGNWRSGRVAKRVWARRGRKECVAEFVKGSE